MASKKFISNYNFNVGNMAYQLSPHHSLSPSSLCSRARSFLHKTGLEYLLGFSLTTLSCARGDVTATNYSCTDYDQDQDKFYTTPQCGALLDCDDTNPTTYPGATEFCDEKDNNCNGVADEEVKKTFHEDNDKDGFGDPARYTLGCVLPAGMDPGGKTSYVGNGSDCNDLNKDINPEAGEICDGQDNNCNQSIDDDLEPPDRICTAGIGQCLSFGLEYKTCLGTNGWSDEFSGCDALPNEPDQELCDSADQDCDGNPYNGYNVGQFCSVGVGSCQAEGIYVCSPDGLFTLCGAVEGQPAEEICDGIDNDCDAQIDEELAVPTELCSTGLGSCEAFGSRYKICLGDAGWSSWFSPCDAVPSLPTAEACDGQDNDCNNFIDDNLTAPAQECFAGIGACRRSGLEYKVCQGWSEWSEEYSGCTAVPGESAVEICDGEDNDCNDLIDDVGNLVTLFADDDGDSFGNIDDSMQLSVCSLPQPGYVANSLDCDDTNSSIHPLADELCDGVDNNCNYEIDDTLIAPAQECFAGLGECRRSGLEYKVCQGWSGWSEEYSGCTAVPGEPAEEICDGLDNDCDGFIDGNLAGTICDCENIDNFNRPNQEGLGSNASGNPWGGSAGYWQIIDGTAVVSNTTGGGFAWTYLDIGHRSTFDIVTRWKTNRVSALADGALILRMNANNSGTGGLMTRSCKADCTTHTLEYPDLVLIGIGYTPLLSPNVYYLTNLAYDGTTLKLKIWEEGTAEPANFLTSATIANTPPSQHMISLGSTVMSGTLTIDYIIDRNCDN